MGAYEGYAFKFLIESRDETGLVLRIGTGGVVDRADVEARMGTTTNTDDRRIVRPEPPDQ